MSDVDPGQIVPDPRSFRPKGAETESRIGPQAQGLPDQEAIDKAERSSIEAAHMQPVPINPSWIIHGSPHARWAELSRSRDRTASTVLWDCTAGEFNWSYGEDETAHILEGEAIVESGSECRSIEPGDVVLFHAGSTWRWRVPIYVKKIAFLRTPLPRPFALALKACRLLKARPQMMTGPSV